MQEKNRNYKKEHAQTTRLNVKQIKGVLTETKVAKQEKRDTRYKVCAGSLVALASSEARVNCLLCVLLRIVNFFCYICCLSCSLRGFD